MITFSMYFFVLECPRPFFSLSHLLKKTLGRPLRLPSAVEAVFRPNFLHMLKSIGLEYSINIHNQSWCNSHSRPKHYIYY